MPKLLDRLFDDGTNRVNVICSRIAFPLVVGVVAVLLLVSACASPLADRRVSKQWAVDVCAELDRRQQRACMEEGLREAPSGENEVQP